MNTTRKILSFAIILILVLVFSDLWAVTTGAIDGYVKDLTTDQPLEGVKITLVSAKTKTLSFELTTDKKGHFYKSGLVPGNYTMTMEKEGYVPQGGSIRVVLEKTIRLELKLEPAKSSELGDLASAKKAASGAKLISSGKYEEAIIKFTEVIGQVSLNPVPYFYRGLAYERSGKMEEALQDYQKATELKADFILPYTRSGIIWARKGDFEKAAEFYKKAIGSGDQDSTTYYNYGVSLTNLGKSEEARIVFERLLAQDPGYSDVYYQLGTLCLSAGETTRAKELLETFIAKDPENKNAALAREILKSLNEEL